MTRLVSPGRARLTSHAGYAALLRSLGRDGANRASRGSSSHVGGPCLATASAEAGAAPSSPRPRGSDDLVTLTRSELDQQPGTPARALARAIPTSTSPSTTTSQARSCSSWSAGLSPAARSSTIAGAESPEERISGNRGLRSSALRSQLSTGENRLSASPEHAGGIAPTLRFVHEAAPSLRGRCATRLDRPPSAAMGSWGPAQTRNRHCRP
jgi:hypothetical protein